MYCILCGSDVPEDELEERKAEAAAQADALGMESLTEESQAIIEGCILCADCML